MNRAYIRRVRETITKLSSGTDYTTAIIDITEKDLHDSLQEVPRSLTGRAVGRFLKEVDRFCGSSGKKKLSESLYGTTQGT